jgi:two-component system, LytTR family, sensor kinase
MDSKCAFGKCSTKTLSDRKAYITLSSMQVSAIPKLTVARRVGAVAIVATILTLFFATKDSFHQQSLGSQVTWGKNLWWKAMEWYAWGLFAPIIFRACRRFDFSSNPWRTVVTHLACGALASLLHCCVLTTGARIEAEVMRTGFSWAGLFKFVFANHFHEDVLTYAAIVSVWYALDYHNRFRERERRAAELEAHLAQARLQALKTQLHPHFLFNTLNGIAALIYEEPKAAHRMLARLSDLLRMSLQDSGVQEVALRWELEFGRRYLELEQIRLGDRLAVEFDIAPSTLEACVPKLLLQPLLENAIKHAIAPFSSLGQICVYSRRNNETLHLRVSDNGPGLPASNEASERLGIGLNNTRARLRELYGDGHKIELKNGDSGGLVVEIAIPFHAAAGQEASIEADYEDSRINCR